MGEAVRTVDQPRWGPAEKAAIDRCLALPNPFDTKLGMRQPRLSRLIETEIIPRLMLAHRAERQPVDDVPLAAIGTVEIAELVSLALSAESHLSLGFANRLLGCGHALEAVLLHALGGAARLLGDMWREDLCSFGDVTIGLANLQQVLRALGSSFDTAADSPGCGRIFLAAVPGEQHRFSVAILDAIFRQAGWDTATADALQDMRLQLKLDWFDVIGVSLSCDVLFEHVKPTIQALRRASRNPSPLVMVGGRFFIDHPECAAEVGADVAVADAPEALRLAHQRSGSRLVHP
jgi:methanogenic corrinoid protein MtbC1